MPEYFDQPDDDPEVEPSKWAGTISAPKIHPLLPLIQRTSDIHRLKRIVAWIPRLIHKGFSRAFETRFKPFPVILD